MYEKPVNNVEMHYIMDFSLKTQFTTINILESDIISKKICQKCYKNTRKIYEIRQTAHQQNKQLKQKSLQNLSDTGIRLPNTCITIKKDKSSEQKSKTVSISDDVAELEDKDLQVIPPDPPELQRTVKITGEIKGIHSSIIDVYRKYPSFKLPKKCINRHMAPIVSLTMGDVETYFKDRKLDIFKYVSKACGSNRTVNRIAKKSTSAPMKVRKLVQSSTENSTNGSKKNIIIHGSFTLPKEKVVLNTQNNNQIDVVRCSSFRDGLKSPKTKRLPNRDSCEPQIFRLSICSDDENETPERRNILPHKSSISNTTKDAETNMNNLNNEFSSAQDTCATQESPSNGSIKRKSSNSIENSPNLKVRKTWSEVESEIPTTSQNTIPLLDFATTNAPITLKVETTSPSPLSTNTPVQRNNETVLLPTTSKPEFIQSLGLTPATTTTHTPSILICKICNSKHQNVAALKKHNSRHRVCPYCKVKFKSVERKQKHIDCFCEVKKILESPGTFVSLEQVEVIDEFKNKYKELFSSFGIISDVEADVPVTVDLTEQDTVIVLSDNEEKAVERKEVDQQVCEKTTLHQELVECVPIGKPVISIYDDTILNTVIDNLLDKDVIKEVLTVLRKETPINTDQTQQTPQPNIEDLAINKNDTCRLKDFKGYLLSHLVPVNLKKGNFSVSYIPTEEPVKPKNLAHWSDTELIDKQNKQATQDVQMINATYPLTFVTSQVQSSQVSLSSIQVMTGTPTMSIILPNTSAFIPNAGISIQPGVTQTQTINNTFFTPISTSTSIQTTPLLQNYTLSMGPLPIINNQMPMQTTTVTTNNVGETKSTEGSEKVNSTITPESANASTHQQSETSSRIKRISKKTSPGKSKKHSKRPVIKLKIGKLKSPPSKGSKLRVKNIWELK